MTDEYTAEPTLIPPGKYQARMVAVNSMGIVALEIVDGGQIGAKVYVPAGMIHPYIITVDIETYLDEDAKIVRNKVVIRNPNNG